jgi:hypothetical protein
MIIRYTTLLLAAAIAFQASASPNLSKKDSADKQERTLLHVGPTLLTNISLRNEIKSSTWAVSQRTSCFRNATFVVSDVTIWPSLAERYRQKISQSKQYRF